MEKGLAVSMTQPMIQNAMESLDGMREFAKVILNSGIAPHYLYEKKPDGKIDFTKGNVEKLMGVFIKGDQLKMHPLTAMQEVVPVNGLLSIKGDGAKSLILQSGKIKKGTWNEKSEGDIETGTYKVTITATREDTGETLSRSFSVAQAKRAGLWITQEMLQKNDGWKKKQSAWYKFPERMMKYRALGFLARDLFSDVLSGTYTLEEAQDYIDDVSTEIVTEGGATVVIPDKQFADDRSKRITGTASEKIDKANAFVAPPADNEPPPWEQQKPSEEKELPAVFHWTEAALAEAKAKDLEFACMSVDTTRDALTILPGKNTNKKLRIIIMAYMAGELIPLVNKHRRTEGPVEPTPAPPEAEKKEGAERDISRQYPATKEESYPATPPVGPDDGLEAIEESEQEEEIPANTKFDNQDEPPVETPSQEEDGSIPEDTNKFDIEVPELSENNDRPFEVLSQLYFAMQEKQILNQQFDEANAKLLKGKYKNMEEFCKLAPVSEINLLLNSIG